MSFWMVFLIAVSLCFDTLAVSMVGGACTSGRSRAKDLLIIGSFALFQGGFALLGWLLGHSVLELIDRFDHWIAFLLLSWIGLKMVVEALRPGRQEEGPDLLKPASLVMASVATSIDALAVGISFAMMEMPLATILLDSLLIAAVTAVAAAIGLYGGKHLGDKFGRRCNLIGGLVLFLIGVKILLEHLLAG
ncbi:MAG: manganese efflux pump [Bacteroidales bacterium]|nr:manganese efflux pump [Bacteroidales bacterium]